MPLSPGAKLGPYEILAPIGAMGEVCLALDTRIERAVAIKVSTTEFSKRFERQARFRLRTIRTSASSTTWERESQTGWGPGRLAARTMIWSPDNAEGFTAPRENAWG